MKTSRARSIVGEEASEESKGGEESTRVASTGTPRKVTPVPSPKKGAAAVSTEPRAAPKTPPSGARGKRFNKLVSEILTPPIAVGGDRGEAASPTRTVLAFGRECTKLPIEPRTEHVYRLIRQSTGALGGNGNTGAIYGELTMASMQKVINVLVRKCGMNDQSRFIDVGSGLGKPNLHAAQDPAVRLSVGIELEHIRWQLAMYNLFKITDVLSRGKEPDRLLSGTNFLAGDVDEAVSMDPFTHIYMYDLGFPPPLQQSIARKFNSSIYARFLVSYRPPNRVIDEYGYEVELVDQLPTAMHGSGESHMAYVYRRTNNPMSETLAAAQPNLKRLVLPCRPGFTEVDESVYCDKAFYMAAKLAVGSVATLHQHCAGVVDVLLNSAKPKRDRKARVLPDM